MALLNTKNDGRKTMAYSKIVQAALGAVLFMSLPAAAQETSAAGGVPADWVGATAPAAHGERTRSRTSSHRR
jgi:hypothetical protein